MWRIHPRKYFSPKRCNAVYVWPTLKGYHVEEIVPRRYDLHARLGETAEEVLRGLPKDAASFLFHIDLTDSGRCPLNRQRLVEQLHSRGVRVWNADVTSIAKRTVHAAARSASLPCAAATFDGDGDEYVIVKTDRNYGGRSERWLRLRDRRRLAITEGSSVIQDTRAYRVMRRAEVPAEYWDDPDLVVERFIPSADERLHRVYVSLGRFAFWSGYCPSPVKKLADCSDVREYYLGRGEEHPAVPRELPRTMWAFTEAFPLDFGAVDLIAGRDGLWYVIDVNATSWHGTHSPHRTEFLRGAWDDVA